MERKEGRGVEVVNVVLLCRRMSAIPFQSPQVANTTGLTLHMPRRPVAGRILFGRMGAMRIHEAGASSKPDSGRSNQTEQHIGILAGGEERWSTNVGGRWH